MPYVSYIFSIRLTLLLILKNTAVSADIFDFLS